VESSPAAGTVRRTVRVAVALVVGQALLCALIGWLTLGRGHGSGSSVDQMAAPPAVPPTVTSRHVTPGRSVATASVATASPAGGTRTADRKAPRSPAIRATSTRPADPPDPAPPTPAPAPATSETPALPVPTIVATTTGPGSALAPPVPPSPTVTDTSEPITIGDYCRPEGAYAIAADGTLVRCVRTWRHRPRWKIV
jgi:hypothetical protein